MHVQGHLARVTYLAVGQGAYSDSRWPTKSVILYPSTKRAPVARDERNRTVAARLLASHRRAAGLRGDAGGVGPYCLEVLGSESTNRPGVCIYLSGFILVCQDDGDSLFRRVGTYRLKSEVDRLRDEWAEDVELSEKHRREWFSSRPVVEIWIV